MHRGLLSSLVALASLLAAGPRSLHADEADERLRLLGRPEHDQHAAALAWWEQREPKGKVAMLRHARVALLVHAGLPGPAARELLLVWDEELDAEGLPQVRRLLADGDAEGAVASAAQALDVHLLGLIPGDRARGRLEVMRTARHLGAYHAATAGLAIAGEEAATNEIRAFLADDRDWMLGALPDETWSHLAERWLVEHWVERLDSNCCLGWRSMVALRSIHPTIPFEDAYGGAGTERTRAWIRSHTWKHSRLVDGLVPVGE